MNLCDYGCDKEAKYFKKNGKKCCSSHHTKCIGWQQTREEENIKKFGVKNPAQLKSVREKMKKTCLIKYGAENPNQNKDVIEKRKKTNQERYGGNAPLNSDVIKKKAQTTLFEKYGVINPALTENGRNGFDEYINDVQRIESMKIRVKDTKKNRYGDENYANIDQHRKTIKEKYGVDNVSQIAYVKELKKKKSLKRYGVENVLQSDEIKKKIKKTNIERYGVENPSQNAEISQKGLSSSFKRKEYIFPSGRIEFVQGNEPIILDKLLNEEKINENDILVKRTDMPELWWEDFEGKNHRYYPDIFIPIMNRLIEVKSSWTNRNDEKIQDMITRKLKSANDAGYKIELIEV